MDGKEVKSSKEMTAKSSNQDQAYTQAVVEQLLAGPGAVSAGRGENASPGAVEGCPSWIFGCTIGTSAFRKAIGYFNV
jgi:hypothetical protein